MISSIMMTVARETAYPLGRAILSEEIVSPFDVVKIAKAEWTVWPCMRLEAMPVEAHVICATLRLAL